MKGKLNRLLLMLLVCNISLLAFGQGKRIITGTVKDSSGAPLSGSNISVKGTTIGTSADAQGHFKIDVPTGKNVLTVSSVGYGSQEIKIGADNNVQVVLTFSNSLLNEVVITGFGEKRQRRNLGYSVAQVNGDVIRGAATISPVDALVGQVAGLQVQSGVGGPSATPKIVLRGSSVLNTYANQPLFVVDGVIIDQQTATANKSGQYGDGPDFGNILKDINPDDIENISVLKGGSVTALYGSQAANGVILITTKKGSAARGLGINLSNTDMLIQPYKTVDFQNQFGAGLGSNDWDHTSTGGLKILNGYGASFGPAMTGQMVTDINGIMRPNNPLPNNILDFFQTGHDINNNASFSGGNERSSFISNYTDSRREEHCAIIVRKNKMIAEDIHHQPSWYMITQA